VGARIRETACPFQPLRYMTAKSQKNGIEPDGLELWFNAGREALHSAANRVMYYNGGPCEDELRGNSSKVIIFVRLVC